MIYIILLFVFLSIGTATYAAYQPILEAGRRRVFRQKEHVQRELEQMFIFLSVDGLHGLKWGLTLLAGLLALVLTWEAKPPIPMIVAVLAGAVGYWLPELYILRLRKKRLAAFSEQLVDGLVLMSSGLRSGYSLLQAIEMLIKEMPAPISQEFDLVRWEWIELNGDIDQALRNCVERTKDPDLELMVNAVQITRQLGGNLAEVFDRIVAMVRERKIIAGKAEALTAEGRLQAMVVGLLPYGFGICMVKVNTDLMRVMWTTVPGFLALLAVIILDVVGYLWVRKSARIEF